MTTRRWVRVCSLAQLEAGRGVAALVGGEQVAVFLLAGPEGGPPRLRAVDNRDPASGAPVLSRGLVGFAGDTDYVASPMFKHRFDLSSGLCLDDPALAVRVWPVRAWGRTVEVLEVTGRADGPVEPVPAGGGPAATHCPYCALQCAMTVSGDGRIGARPDFPVTEGRMCVKGWSAGELLRHPDRLTGPLVRDGSGRLRGASWDAALDELAARLAGTAARHGSGAVGVFGSGALTNEKAYLLGKFARLALRTPNFDYNGRFCMASAAAAQNRSFGLDRGLPFPLSDLAEADTLTLWGANPADTMPPLMQWVDRQAHRGGRLVVVDPRRTATAERAHIHLRPRPGTDLAVALGLLRLAVEEGMVDDAFIAGRTGGWPAVRASVAEWTPGRCAAVAGVAEADLRAAADAIGRPGATGTGTSMLITGRGPEQQSKGTDTVTALINLMLALGQVGRPGGGYGCLTGQGNGQGGREHGQKSDQLPGYRRAVDDDDRRTVAAAWGVPPSDLTGPGMTATEMIAAMGAPGGLRAMVVAGSNLAVAAPDGTVTARGLAALDVLAVLDPFLTETAAHASFVLPVTMWAEEDGTTTSLEGRVLRRRRAVTPPAGVRSDIEILCALAARLGVGHHFDFSGPEAVFEELRRVSAGGRADYAGISYDRLDAAGAGSGRGVFWPCPSPDHPGTPRLFADRFAHPDGRARFVAVSYRPPAEEPDADRPLVLTTGRYREHYNSGGQTRRVPRLAEARPGPRLEMHPDTAAAMGVADGDAVTVRSRRGSAVYPVSLDDGIRTDTVFAPFHWGGPQSANVLTSAACDPLSAMPEFKVSAVDVRPADGPAPVSPPAPG